MSADTSNDTLRVLIITEDDPIYVIKFFEVFFRDYPRDAFDIVAVTVEKAFHETLRKTIRRMWKFYGPVDFVKMGFRYVFTKLGGKSIARLAGQHGLTLLPCESVNKPDYIEQVRKLNVDVIMSVAAPEIFRKDILNAANIGCINIHSGRLPKYRGMMPTFWQLLEGEDKATVTIHEMVEKLDAGDVIGTVEFDLRPRDVLDRVIVGTKQAGATLMIDVLHALKNDTVRTVPLNMDESSYFKFPKPDDVKQFRAKGHRLL
jgi:methionyl-tRNA formyltransferase